MTHIAFFEPSYSAAAPNDWEIRGSYKYPSLLGDLHERATISILMKTLPPEEDAHRQALTRDFGVRFAEIESIEDAGAAAVDAQAADYAEAIAAHDPTIVSTLNGRMIGYNFALARAAREMGREFVYRIAGNDIVTRTAVLEAQGYAVTGTSFWAELAAEERFAAEAAARVIVMGGTERARAAGLVSDPEKIRVCRRGVDRAHFAPPAEPPERCDRFLFLGRDSEEKGIDLIEEAAAIVAEQRRDIGFTLAGDFAAREEGNCRYLGFHDYRALPGLYRAHHALLLPARSEGFPQVVMEGMSCGLPAILSRHLFEHDFGEGEGAELVALDAAEIARVAIALHDDAPRFAAMRDAALAKAAAEFDATANRPLYHRALLGGSA